jgi:hypothetical protein
VLADAWRRTWRLFAPTFEHWPLLWGLFVVGAAIHWLLYGTEAVLADVLTTASFGVLAVGAGLLLAFAFNLVVAPYRLWREAKHQLDQFHREAAARIEERAKRYLEVERVAVKDALYRLVEATSIGKLWREEARTQGEMSPDNFAIKKAAKLFRLAAVEGKITVYGRLPNDPIQQSIHQDCWRYVEVSAMVWLKGHNFMVKHPERVHPRDRVSSDLSAPILKFDEFYVDAAAFERLWPRDSVDLAYIGPSTRYEHPTL